MEAADNLVPAALWARVLEIRTCLDLNWGLISGDENWFVRIYHTAITRKKGYVAYSSSF